MKNYNNLNRSIHLLLLINNLAGICLFPELTVMSLIVVLGVPGVLFLFVAAYWYFKPKYRDPSLYMSISTFYIIYNVFIYSITNEVGGDKEFKTLTNLEAAYFPMINVILFSVMFAFNIYFSISMYKAEKHDKADF